MYKYIHTCIYIHVYTSAHIHTYTCIHTHIQHVHINARKYAWNDGAAANVRGAVADAGSFARPFRLTQSDHILHRQCKDFIVPTSWDTNTPQPPIPSSQHTHKQFADRRCAVSSFLFHTDQHNRVHSSEEAPRSFTMATCVFVERLEGRQLCSRASRRARRTPSPRMTKVTVHKKRKVNEEQSSPTAAHHTITTTRRPDNTTEIPYIARR